MSGFCGISTQLNSGAVTGVLVQLGSEDAINSSCFNGYVAGSALGLPMPSAGTLKNLTVVSNVNGSYPIAVSVYINGVSTSIVCTITTPNTCTDTETVTGHSATVSAGDTVAVQLSASNVPLGSLSVHASLEKQ